jgi:hypothetical protein
MLRRDFPVDKIADWMAINGLRHSNQMVSRTFKIAKREDLLEYFIQESDIKVGDTVQSRMTARIGKVKGIHKDGDTIEVHWDAGGSQLIGKESVYKLRSKDMDIETPHDLTKVKTIYDNYGDIKKNR